MDPSKASDKDDNKNDTMLKYLRENSALVELLRNPETQQRIISVLAEEKRFLDRPPHQNHRNRYSQKKSAGFPNPNQAPISPLEKALIEGDKSKEQQALRLLLKDILGQD